jgi:hypothetical protein
MTIPDPLPTDSVLRTKGLTGFPGPGVAVSMGKHARSGIGWFRDSDGVRHT